MLRMPQFFKHVQNHISFMNISTRTMILPSLSQPCRSLFPFVLTSCLSVFCPGQWSPAPANKTSSLPSTPGIWVPSHFLLVFTSWIKANVESLCGCRNKEDGGYKVCILWWCILITWMSLWVGCWFNIPKIVHKQCFSLSLFTGPPYFVLF